MPRYNLFSKIVTLILIMLIPIMGLYFYSNKTSTEVLGSELNKSNINQLTFFQNQVNTNISMLGMWPNILLHDPDIFNLRYIFDAPRVLNLDTLMLIERIQTKLLIQEASSNWQTNLSVYSPILQRAITRSDLRAVTDNEIQSRLKPRWQVERVENGMNGEERFVFSLATFAPFSALNQPEKANLIIEVQFDSRNIEDMLDQFKHDGRTDPFYYKKGMGVILNRSADEALSRELIEKLETNELQNIESRTVSIEGEQYLVNLVRSEAIGWYLIDYIPLKEILHPIEKTNRLFYISATFLLLMSCLAAYLLYAQVQVPMKQLVQSFQKLKMGDYSVRLERKGTNEFSFVFSRFNAMVSQIQDLFERVFLEKIHVREARLKQLQSQINPHFFYNCFSYISSMAKLKDFQAIVAMSQNLSKYYRYTTRQEKELVPLHEEMDFVVSYLEIQKMRMKRMNFTVDIPPRMRKTNIPPLMIQPLVENAVLHGIETSNGAGHILIKGECYENGFRLIVEDDGKGMEPLAMSELQEKLFKPMEEEMGCGLWNVRQRIRLRYGDKSDMILAKSEWGGLKVSLSWTKREDDSLYYGGGDICD
jgi:two-component system sensor histidine kinase YesM